MIQAMLDIQTFLSVENAASFAPAHRGLIYRGTGSSRGLRRGRMRSRVPRRTRADSGAARTHPATTSWVEAPQAPAEIRRLHERSQRQARRSSCVRSRAVEKGPRLASSSWRGMEEKAMKQIILVVDDQEDERDAMARLLQRHHYVVESAADGREALDRLQDGAPLPDLVLLDLNMPVMDGWEFLFHVAQNRSLRHVPLVVISGSPAVRHVIAVPPNVAFVAKPVRPLVIMKIIAEMLQDAAARAPTASDDDIAAMSDGDTERHMVAGHEAAPVRLG
jgi:CheY-like chemotaxis protein